MDSVVFLIAPENARSRRAVEKIGAVEIGERLGADGRPSVANRIEGKSWGASAGPLPEP